MCSQVTRGFNRSQSRGRAEPKPTRVGGGARFRRERGMPEGKKSEEQSESSWARVTQSQGGRRQTPGTACTELLAALQVGVDQRADRGGAIREVDVCCLDPLAVEVLRETRDLQRSPRLLYCLRQCMGCSSPLATGNRGERRDVVGHQNRKQQNIHYIRASAQAH